MLQLVLAVTASTTAEGTHATTWQTKDNAYLKHFPWERGPCPARLARVVSTTNSLKGETASTTAIAVVERYMRVTVGNVENVSLI
jgi:hypothetical protein